MPFGPDDLDAELKKLGKSKKTGKKQTPKAGRSFDLGSALDAIPSQAQQAVSGALRPSRALGQWLDSKERFGRIPDITEIGKRLKLPDGVSVAENVLMAFYEPRDLEGKIRTEGWGNRIRALLLLNQDIGSDVWMKGGLKKWSKLRDAFDEAGLLPPQRKYQMVGSPWLDVPGFDAQLASKELVNRMRKWEDQNQTFHIPNDAMIRLAQGVIDEFSKRRG